MVYRLLGGSINRSASASDSGLGPRSQASGLRPPGSALGLDLGGWGFSFVNIPTMRISMNIKSVMPSPISQIEPKKRVEGGPRTHASSDRDADGRQQQAEQEAKRHLNDDELADAIKAIEEMPGLKANNLKVKVEVKDDCRVILIVDGTGQIIRRLSEAQLWAASRDKDRATGKILDKAM